VHLVKVHASLFFGYRRKKFFVRILFVSRMGFIFECKPIQKRGIIYSVQLVLSASVYDLKVAISKLPQFETVFDEGAYDPSLRDSLHKVYFHFRDLSNSIKIDDKTLLKTLVGTATKRTFTLYYDKDNEEED
jgi:hypothetical protein